VRKAGNRVRITTQLIEAASGAHLWADRYDGALEDVFDLQDQITDGVVGIVEPSLQRSEIERARRKHPDNLDAYDLYLRALPHLASITPANARTAAGFWSAPSSWTRTTPPPMRDLRIAMRYCSRILVSMTPRGAPGSGTRAW
jgi:hypothetical protein